MGKKMPEPVPTPKTKKVRIAVAIDNRGFYQVVGWCDSAGDPDDKMLVNAAEENFAVVFDREAKVVHFVDAEVPMPEEGQTVQGKVS